MLLLEKIEEKRIQIIIIVLIITIIGGLYSIKYTVNEYISTSTVLLMKTEKISEKESKNIGNLEISNKQIATFSQILKSDTTIKNIEKEVGIESQDIDLKENIEIKRNSNSDTFKIQVKHFEAEKALQINRKLLEKFSEKLEEVYSNTELYIVDNPHITKTIYTFSIIISLIKSTLIGLIVSFVYIIIICIKEKNQKININIEKEINLKKLIEIPLKIEKNTKNSKNELIAYENKKSATSKAFKTLRSNIQFVNVNNDKKNIILVTSPNGKEGKSYVAANIAISFAEVGKKVILIDSDMNSGRQNKMFSIPNNLGFSNYLSSLDTNGVEIKKLTNNFINETSIKNLNLITSGTIPPNSSELLATEKLEELIKDLSVFYDVVVIDGTSVLESIDSLIIARIATSTILVSNYKKTKKEELQKSKRDIQNTGGRTIGIIINKVKEKKTKEQIKKDVTETKNKIKNNINKLLNNIKDRKEKTNQKLLTEASTIKSKQENNKKVEKTSEINYVKTKKAIVKENDIKISENEVSKDIEIKQENNLNNTKNTSKLKKTRIDKITIIDDKIEPTKQSNLIEKKISKTKIESKDINQPNNIEEDINNTKLNNLVSEKIKELKKYYVDFLNDIKPIVKEKVSDAQGKVQEVISKIKNNNNLNTEVLESEESVEKNIIAKTNNHEIIQQNTQNKDINDQKIHVNEIIDEDVRSDEAVLIIVDAERGFCRVFSKICFTEKSINGFSKTDRLVRDQYSSKITKTRYEKIMDLYDITKQQVQRIDPLIYTTLSEYDEYNWIERKMISNKAESYVLCMIKDFEKMPNETEEEYLIRCKTSRIQELKKAEIDIEYKLDNLWKNTKTSIIDKISIKKYSDIYENPQKARSSIEIKKSMKNKAFYDDIIKKAENKLEQIEEFDEEKGTIEELEELNKKIELEKIKREEKEKKIQERKEKNKEKQLEKQKQNEKRKEEKIKKQEDLRKIREERLKKQEELKKQKEEERERQKEEARIEEELLIDNLYPKTKNNRNI